MFLPSDLVATEGEQVQSELLVDLSIDLFLPQLIEELVGECLSGIQSLLGRVYHDLADEV